MKVFVLFRETNSGHGEGSDGYVESVYATEALAEEARLAHIRAARDAGEAIWFDPDHEDGADQAGDPFWTHDWHVEEHTVLDALAHAATPTPQGGTP